MSTPLVIDQPLINALTDNYNSRNRHLDENGHCNSSVNDLLKLTLYFRPSMNRLSQSSHTAITTKALVADIDVGE